jgi:hypothetical protein
MATKKKTPTVAVVVRRGAIRRFHKLKQKTESLPVEVSWDRRLGDRRTASDEPGMDRRKTDRRQKPPFTWEVGDFVIATKTGQRNGK